MADELETRDRPPAGSLPIDQTEWAGDHPAIKEAIDAKPPDNVVIDPEQNVWLEKPDGTWINFGPAGTFTGSSRPSGRRGKDRQSSRRRARAKGKRRR